LVPTPLPEYKTPEVHCLGRCACQSLHFDAHNSNASGTPALLQYLAYIHIPRALERCSSYMFALIAGLHRADASTEPARCGCDPRLRH
jgi:hypothetical protein